MSLFSTDQTLHLINKEPLTLKTPLGDLFFKIKINDSFIKIESCSNIKSIQSNNVLMSWNIESCDIECLRINFDPNLPPHMKTDKCFAFIWRIKAIRNLEVSLNCLLKTSLSASPETGEYLIAQSFEDKSIKLCIGTEDEEGLRQRAKNKNWMPYRLVTEINADNICYLDKGLEVHFSLLQEEKIQIQFITAWCPIGNKEISAWYAVDQSSIEILKQSGFY
jgi:hypothetical protein